MQRSKIVICEELATQHSCSKSKWFAIVIICFLIIGGIASVGDNLISSGRNLTMDSVTSGPPSAPTPPSIIKSQRQRNLEIFCSIPPAYYYPPTDSLYQKRKSVQQRKKKQMQKSQRQHLISLKESGKVFIAEARNCKILTVNECTVMIKFMDGSTREYSFKEVFDILNLRAER